MKRPVMAVLFAVLCLNPAGLMATTTTDLNDYSAALKQMFTDVSALFADPLARITAFTTGAQSFSPPDARKTMGFNIGVGAGFSATPLDKTAFNAKAAKAGVGGSFDALPAYFPLPLPALNAHLGLPGFLFFESMEAGLRFKGLSYQDSLNMFSVTDVGLEFRGNVFEAGLITPVNFTLGLSLSFFKGVVDLGMGQQAVSVSGTTGTLITGTPEWKLQMDMQNTAVVLGAEVSRKFLFFMPYAGLGLQVNTGQAVTRLKQTGTLTSKAFLQPTVISSLEVAGETTAYVPSMEVRLGTGFDLVFGPFYINVGGEYGLVSGGFGGNVQMGLRFR